MTINQRGSFTECYSDVNNCTHYYISIANIGSILKYRHTRYINCIELGYYYKIYHIKYWTKKDVE